MVLAVGEPERHFAIEGSSSLSEMSKSLNAGEIHSSGFLFIPLADTLGHPLRRERRKCHPITRWRRNIQSRCTAQLSVTIIYCKLYSQ